MGFLGILEDKHLAHVPATVVLSEEENNLSNRDTSGLKRGTGRDADIILIPQPYVCLATCRCSLSATAKHNWIATDDTQVGRSK